MEEPFHHAGSAPARTVLVVDDSMVECMLATAVLQKLGCSVVCVASAEQALMRMAGSRFDLAICDVSLPDMDGLTLLATMRAAAQALPCIVLSAHDDGRYAEAALRAGAHAYMVKPLQLASMRAALETLFP
jgi:CheY-like chemotaxis protein